MTPERFIKIWRERMGYNQKQANEISGWEPEDFQKLAELTLYVEYDCNFDEHGRCQGIAGSKIIKNKEYIMCCCTGCRRCIGFIYQLPKDKSIVRKYAELFDEDFGFWREGGCGLPRSLRHGTCLTYNCKKADKKFSSAQQKLLHVIGQSYTKLRIKNGRTYTNRRNFIRKLEEWLEEEKLAKRSDG